MPKKKKMIYLVEDDQFLVRMYEMIFKLNGYDYQIAVDGQKAIDELPTLKPSPDLIVLDVMMPKKDGLEVLEYIKDNDLFKGVPVVMLSNFVEDALEERALKLGASHFLRKTDYPPKKLVEKIEEIIKEG